MAFFDILASFICMLLAVLCYVVVGMYLKDVTVFSQLSAVEKQQCWQAFALGFIYTVIGYLLLFC